MAQQELPIYMKHDSGHTTITYMTVALVEDQPGEYELWLTMRPVDELSEDRSYKIGPKTSCRAVLEMASALIHGRLVRDFTARGRLP